MDLERAETLEQVLSSLVRKQVLPASRLDSRRFRPLLQKPGEMRQRRQPQASLGLAHRGISHDARHDSDRCLSHPGCLSYGACRIMWRARIARQDAASGAVTGLAESGGVGAEATKHNRSKSYVRRGPFPTFH